MSTNVYLMSYTTGGLYYGESITLAERYLQLKDWQMVRDEVVESGLLQVRTMSAAKKIFSEVAERLKLLSESALQLLVDGSRTEQQHLLWLGLCKRYRFIREFAVEVVREKFLRLDYTITPEEYDIFFYDKAEWHEELDKLTKTTQRKLKQVLFRMLRDAGLLTDMNTIQPTMLSQTVADVIKQDVNADFRVFPVSDMDIQEWMK